MKYRHNVRAMCSPSPKKTRLLLSSRIYGTRRGGRFYNKLLKCLPFYILLNFIFIVFEAEISSDMDGLGDVISSFFFESFSLSLLNNSFRLKGETGIQKKNLLSVNSRLVLLQFHSLNFITASLCHLYCSGYFITHNVLI